MMRRLLTSSIIMAAVSLEATAIDANGARQVAADIYLELHNAAGSETARPEMQIVAIDSLHASPTYYVCEPIEGAGYFIISAVEGTPELIAYSETDSYQNGQPAPFRELLADYAERLAEKSLLPMQATERQDNASTLHRTVQQSYASTINPLVQTYWAQATPYNNLCPEKEGERCLTGCTATAMSQILNYHKYPAVGTGIADKATMAKQRLDPLDLSQYPFDWENMLDTYQNVEYTENQANAVATLMRSCGYAAQMDYNTDVSGAYQEHARKALIENFGYSTTARNYLRNSYERSTWLNMIHEELVAGRPIMYAGQASGGGHAFICDGWGVRNTVHINWGWGEGFNLTVDVDVMAPRGSNDGYTRDMKCIMGIQPMVEGEDRTLPYNLDLCDSLKFKPSNKMYTIPGVYNLCPDRINVNFGFCIRQGEEVVQYINLNKNANIQFIGHSNPIYGVLSLPALEDGEYSLQMVVKPKDCNDWITVNPGDRTDGFTFTMSNGEMTFGELTSIGQIAAEPAGNAIENASFSLSGTRISNSKPVHGFSISNGKVVFTR